MIIIRSLIGFDGVAETIGRITGNTIRPQAPEVSKNAIEKFLRKHPLISKAELREAFFWAGKNMFLQYAEK